MEDLRGQTFGKWTVLYRSRDKYGKAAWTCQCSCKHKTQRVVKGTDLKRKMSKSCGQCTQPMIGESIGKWEVLKKAPTRHRHSFWLCRCTCKHKTEREISLKALKKIPKRKTKIGCGHCNMPMVGETYGNWLVLHEVPETDYKRKTIYTCICRCKLGTIRNVEGSRLTAGRTISCGDCRTPLPGELYGRLLIIRESDRKGHKNESFYICRCTCEDQPEIEVKRSHLVKGNTRSCGCLKQEVMEMRGPAYNVDSIRIIEEYGKKHGYYFQHAENGGEVQILTYFVDGYDVMRNVVLEVDEPNHYLNGRLKEKDLQRQWKIMRHKQCTFIRIRIDRKNKIRGVTIFTPSDIPSDIPKVENDGVLLMEAA